MHVRLLSELIWREFRQKEYIFQLKTLKNHKAHKKNEDSLSILPSLTEICQKSDVSSREGRWKKNEINIGIRRGGSGVGCSYVEWCLLFSEIKKRIKKCSEITFKHFNIITNLTCNLWKKYLVRIKPGGRGRCIPYGRDFSIITHLSLL